MGLFDLLAATGAAKSHRHRNRPRTPAGDAGGLLGFLLGNSGPKPSAPSLADLLGLAPPPAPHVDQLPELVPRTNELMNLAFRSEPDIPGSEITRETGPVADALTAFENAPVISSIRHSGEEAAHPHSFASHLKDISLPFLAGVGGPETAGLGRVGATADEATRAAEAASGGARAAAAGQRAGQLLRRGATLPFRRPFTVPIAAQAPAAIASGDPRELGKAFTGSGVLANILGSAAGKVDQAVPGVAGNALADLISLPAQVLPATYLTGAALKEGLIDKDWSRGSELLDAYKRTDFLPALLSGDPGEALSRVGEHPVYSALELGGIGAAAGRGAGIAARSGALGDELKGAASLQHRPPISIGYGDLANVRRPYSPNLGTALLQQARDRSAMIDRPAETPQSLVDAGLPIRSIQATPRQAARYLRSALDRHVFSGEQVRRGAVRQAAAGVEDLRTGTPADDVVSMAVQRIAQNPESFVNDLTEYRQSLIDQRPKLARSELAANDVTVKAIDAALENPTPEGVFAAADSFIRQQAPIQEELVRRGLLDPEQAAKRLVQPWARIHMGAGHGLSNEDAALVEEIKGAMSGDVPEHLSHLSQGQLLGALSRVRSRRQTLDAEGNPLSRDRIVGEMMDRGVDVPGFLTQRMGARGPINWYRAADKRPQIQQARYTGEATARGIGDPSLDALLEQMVGSTSMVESARNFDSFGQRFGLADRNPETGEARYFGSSGEAKAAGEYPGDYGLGLPDIAGGWGTWRIAPFPTRKAELDAAKEFGQPAAASEAGPLDLAGNLDEPNAIENFMADAVERARAPGEGSTVLMPKVVTDRLRGHFQPKTPIEKTLEATTGMFKGAVLPTSPGWLAGNIMDVYAVRSLTGGITPREMVAGKGFAKIMEEEMSPEEASRALESIVPGGLYAQFGRVQPHRAAEQFAGTHLEPIWKAAGAVARTPGLKQVGDLYRRYRDGVFELDGKYVEQTPQYGALAKTARKELNMTRGQFRKAVADGDEAVRQLARGLRNTDKQIRYAKDVEDVFGNWGKNGPEARRFLTTWAPFWMWSRAASKFVFLTMPRDHPILTGLIAASEQMTREERQKLGFDFDAELKMPGFLQGGIPGLETGSAIKTSNLSSFGYFAQPAASFASVPAPQFTGLVLSGLGLDWKGDKLVNADGTPASDLDRGKAAILSTLDGFIPFLNVGRQIATHGPAGALPVKQYDPGTVDYLRSLSQSQQITVPVSGSSSSGSSSSGSVIDSLPGVGSGAGGSFINDLP